ncbi:metal-dependent hydrolase [Chloroflexota bacterium]
MLLFGHIGITVGAAKAGDILLSMAKPGDNQESGTRSRIIPAIGGWRLRLYPWLSRIRGRIGPIDFRMVLLGSLLPDIIDKSGFLLISGASFSGRDYTHTLLFNLVLLTSGLFLTSYRKSWLLIISLSSFMHLILDQIWKVPVTLFWPLLGPLRKGEMAGWLPRIFHGLFTYPEVYISEIIGLVIVLLFAYRLVNRKGIIRFIREGAID